MANGIKIGTNNISGIKIGTADVDAVYIGTNLVYSASTTPSYKWLATYSDSSTSSAECDATSAITSGEVITTDLVAVEIGDCVTSISAVTFLQCGTLTAATLPNTITSIGQSAFAECGSLADINIPSGLTAISNSCFGGCSGLTSMTIPDSVTDIGNSAFQDCKGMVDCTIGSGVTSIGVAAFAGCSELISLTVNALVPPTLGNYAFANTPSRLSVYVPSASFYDYRVASGWGDMNILAN